MEATVSRKASKQSTAASPNTGFTARSARSNSAKSGTYPVWEMLVPFVLLKEMF
jgi:hypothetical protein